MIINKNNRPVRKIYLQLLVLVVAAVTLPIGLISAGTFQQADSNEKSNSQSVVVTSHQDEDDEHPESKRSSTQININTGSNGKSSISVNISSTDDTVSISVSSDGATRKAKLKRKTNEDVTPVVWEVTEYENTAANTDSDDLSWLFVSMGVDAVIMKDDKEYLHPDLTVLSDLVDDADSGSLHDLFRDVRQLISVDARGKVLAIIAARDDFEASDQVELLNLLGRKEMKPRYGFRNPWPSMKATIDVLLEQGNLSDEANEIIEGMRRSDPEYRQQMNRKLQEEHAKLQAEHAKNIAEHAKQLEEHRKLMYKNRQSDYAKQLAEQANDVAEYNKLREAAELQQEKDMQSHARTLERKAEQLMRQAEQLKKQAERARKQVERKQDRN